MSIQQKYSNSSSTVFDVIDNKEMKRISKLRCKNNNLLNLDEWEIYDNQDNLLGIFSEISHTGIITQIYSRLSSDKKYILTIANHFIATYRQSFNHFYFELGENFRSGKYQNFYRRLDNAIAIVSAFQS